MLFIFGGALSADGLTKIPYGFVILFGIVGAGCAMVMIGNKLENYILQSDHRTVEKKV